MLRIPHSSGTARVRQLGAATRIISYSGRASGTRTLPVHSCAHISRPSILRALGEECGSQKDVSDAIARAQEATLEPEPVIVSWDGASAGLQLPPDTSATVECRLQLDNGDILAWRGMVEEGTLQLPRQLP